MSPARAISRGRRSVRVTKWQGSVTHASEAEKAWARVRASLRESAGARLFEQWLKPIELIPGEDRDTIRLALPSAFMTNWVRNHYADRLVLEFKQILPNVRTVQIETRAPGRAPVVLAIEPVADAVSPKPVADPQPVEAMPAPKPVVEPVQASMKFGVDPSLKPAPAPVVASVPVGVPAERPPLDPRYTFARFVVDPSNKVAFNAAKVLAEPGPVRFSPLFLHSGTGQGKTHLMHAIGHAFLEHNPNAIVLCMSAERFMYDFVASMRARDTHAFKQRLRGADLLLIDDLQFIAGKDATQEEFF
ncbi:MAG: chromosomal replication initiator protein DnaA, partial [Sphingomonas sp.]